MSNVLNNAPKRAIIQAGLLLSLSAINAFADTSMPRGGMPIAFEQNRGQAPSDVKFLSRGSSGVLLLSEDAITLQPRGDAAQFRLKLPGASSKTMVVGTGEAGGAVNYIRGNDPSSWVAGIMSYSQVTYKNLYPEIDLVVYGNNRQFESDFVLGKNADPSTISFQVDGHLQVNQDGSLAVKGSEGAFSLHRPFVYQLNAKGERVAIDCHYSIGEAGKVGFAVGQYDHSKPLVIDPIISYSTYLGGSKDDQILGVTGDLLGNIYVTGLTTSLDFPTARPYKATSTGGQDCFVGKFDPTGQRLLYSTYLGGSGDDKCVSIAVNTLGEAFVGGTTFSSNFPTKNAVQGTLKNGQNGFVAHLDSTGSKLVFSTYLGGGGEFLTGVALDLLSNVYATGLTNSANFPVTSGAYQTSCGSTPCHIKSFVSKISPDGCRLFYSTLLGGSDNDDAANGIAVDFTGSAYVSGEAHSATFPTTRNAYQKTLSGVSDAYVVKLSPDGSSLVYATLIGGTNTESARGVAIDLAGDAYITGNTTSTDFPTVNAFQSQFKTGSTSNVFMLKLNNTGSSLTYSTYLGGSGYDYPFGIVVDLFGNASLTGLTYSTDFPTKAAIQALAGANGNAFVASFDPKGKLIYSTYLGGNNGDYGTSIYADPFGCVWVGGYTYSPDFPTNKPFQSKLSGPSDGFLTRITSY